MQRWVELAFSAFLGMLVGVAAAVSASVTSWPLFFAALSAAVVGLAIGAWTLRSRASLGDSSSLWFLKPLTGFVVGSVCVAFSFWPGALFFAAYGIASLGEKIPFRTVASGALAGAAFAIAMLSRFGVPEWAPSGRSGSAQSSSIDQAMDLDLKATLAQMLNGVGGGANTADARNAQGLVVVSRKSTVEREADDQSLWISVAPSPFFETIQTDKFPEFLTREGIRLNWAILDIDPLIATNPLGARFVPAYSVERLEKLFRAMDSGGLVAVSIKNLEGELLSSAVETARVAFRRAGLGEFALHAGTGKGWLYIRLRVISLQERTALSLSDVQVSGISVSSGSGSGHRAISIDHPVSSLVAKGPDGSRNLIAAVVALVLALCLVALGRLAMSERRKGATRWQTLSVLFLLSGFAFMASYFIGLIGFRVEGTGLSVLAVGAMHALVLSAGVGIGMSQMTDAQKRTGLRFQTFVRLLVSLTFALLGPVLFSEFVMWGGLGAAAVVWGLTTLPFGFALGRVIEASWSDVREKLSPSWLNSVVALSCVSLGAGFLSALFIVIVAGTQIAVSILVLIFVAVVVFGNILRPWFVFRGNAPIQSA